MSASETPIQKKGRFERGSALYLLYTCRGWVGWTSRVFLSPHSVQLVMADLRPVSTTTSPTLTLYPPPSLPVLTAPRGVFTETRTTDRRATGGYKRAHAGGGYGYVVTLIQGRTPGTPPTSANTKEKWGWQLGPYQETVFFF